MNKLTVMIASVMVTCVASAASVQWGAVNLYKADGKTKYSGTVELIAVATGGDIADAALVESVTATAAGAVANHTFDWTSAVVGTTYDFYYRINDDGKTLVSTKITGVAASVGSTTVAFGNQASYTQNAGNWATVPEPTSALLMVLGVAGLALRRRRV